MRSRGRARPLFVSKPSSEHKDQVSFRSSDLGQRLFLWAMKFRPTPSFRWSAQGLTPFCHVYNFPHLTGHRKSITFVPLYSLSKSLTGSQDWIQNSVFQSEHLEATRFHVQARGCCVTGTGGRRWSHSSPHAFSRLNNLIPIWFMYSILRKRSASKILLFTIRIWEQVV